MSCKGFVEEVWGVRFRFQGFVAGGTKVYQREIRLWLDSGPWMVQDSRMKV